jgi:hypothetical protein
VQRRAGDKLERPFVSQRDEAQHKVDDLQDRKGFDAGIKVLGEEVEEEFGPEEAFEGGGDLVYQRALSVAPVLTSGIASAYTLLR